MAYVFKYTIWITEITMIAWPTKTVSGRVGHAKHNNFPWYSWLYTFSILFINP